LEYKSTGEKYSSQEYVRAMDSAGVDKSVMLGVDQSEYGRGVANSWTSLLKGPTTKKGWLPVKRELPVVINWDDEDVSRFCKTEPNRFIGFASIHPDRYRPDLKVQQAVEELGLKGVKIYPHSGFYPNDPRLDRVYQKCVDLHVPVMIHTGIKALRTQQMKYNDPVYVDDVATNFPDLDVVMCHGGFPWSDEFLVVAYSNPNIWVDITFLNYIEKFMKRKGLAENTVRQLVDLVGADRLLWGTEGPYMFLPLFGVHGPEEYATSMDFLVKRFDFLSKTEKADMLGENAKRILRL
jgi:predicted TIM-barrel fold metal-dependent hydrolase